MTLYQISVLVAFPPGKWTMLKIVEHEVPRGTLENEQ